jgi:hypothetical protein
MAAMATVMAMGIAMHLRIAMDMVTAMTRTPMVTIRMTGTGMTVGRTIRFMPVQEAAWRC